MLNEYINSSQSLVSFIENSLNPWVIKDTEGKIIYCNQAGLKEHSLPKNFNIEGMLDREIPSKPCQELWEEFARDDLSVIEKNKKISGIEISYYGENNYNHAVPHYFEKAPLYDNNKKILGLIYHANKIDTPSLLYYMNRLNRKTIQFDAPNDRFTKRELEVIFWAQQRLTAKEIAKRLDVYPSTIDSHTKSIYRKADVNNNAQLIEYCKHTGLDAYIPANFIRNGITLIE